MTSDPRHPSACAAPCRRRRAATAAAFAGPFTLALTLVANGALAQWGDPPPPPSGPPPAASPPPPPGISAGGLTPPAPHTPPAPAAEPQEAARPTERDEGRGLEWVWLHGEVGFQSVGLRTFSADEDTLTVGFVDSRASGLVFGGGLGVRLVFVTLGARGRLANLGDWQLWSLDGEVALRVPLGAVEPYFFGGAGYTALGAFEASERALSEGIKIRGFNVRGGGGLDLYLTPAVSLGGVASAEVLALTRPGVTQADIDRARQGGATIDESKERILKLDGSSTGMSFTLTGVLGLHF